MRRAARTSAALVASLATVVAATGWFYVLRGGASLPGPVVHDALALDELPHRASVPLLLYLAVWAVAATLLGLLARWARADALIAGLVLGVGVGAWTYALNGISILVVRQIPAHAAFDAAAREQAIAVPAVLAGVGGALIARSRATGRRRARTILSFLVVGVAALAVVDAMLPEHRRSLVAALDPTHVHGITKALVVPISAGLLVAARALARGSRVGHTVALALLAALLVLNVERRFDDGAIVTGVVVVALLARRNDFRAPVDPLRQRHAVRVAATGVVGVLGYGLGTVWLNRLDTDQPYSVAFALRATGRALAGMSFRGADHLAGAFADWFPVSTFLLGWAVVALVLVEWLAPWRYRLQQGSHERGLAGALVAAWGADTLAPFALRADKSYFFSADESAFLAYRVVGGVAIVAGDPIGPDGERGHLIARFLEFAHTRGWRVAILGACEDCLGLYRSLGLRTIYHGDEAVVDTAAFSLEGRPIRKVRQSTHRLRKGGYTTRVLRPGEIDDDLRAELEDIATEWRGKAPERGFVMAIDALFRLGDDEAVFVVGYDAGGRPEGFLHFAVSRPGAALSLSSMPRRRDVPNGFVEWLIVASIEWARASGYRRVSLNFAPFAALFTRTDLTLPQRLARRALSSLKGQFQLDNLLHFNRKFFPEWQPRFVVYERARDLPRVGVAALAAESYLPFQ